MKFITAKLKTVQIRITLFFLLLLLPLVFISFFANDHSGKVLEEQVGERVGNALLSSMKYVDLTLQSIEEISVLLATDEHMLRTLRTKESVLAPATIVEFQSLLNQISNVKVVNSAISEISILHTASGLMLSTRYGGRRFMDFESEEWYRRVIAANGRTVLIVPDEDRFDADHTLDPVFNTQSITFMRVMDLYDRQGNGNILAITVKKETLLAFAAHLAASGPSDVSLFDGAGAWLTGTSKQATSVPKWTDDGSDILVAKSSDADEDVIYIKAESKHSGWTFLMTLPARELNKDAAIIRTFTYMIIVLSVLLAVLFSWVIYRWISSPLTDLLRGMKQFQLGNMNIKLKPARDDEFGFLVESFNTMAVQHKRFIEETYEQQLWLANMELKFLQSQIHPHFLYNTLNSVYQMAKNYDASDIEEMVMNLSKFFRLSLSKGVESFTVQETVEHLMYYLRIQQIRFRDRLNVNIRVEDDCRDVMLRKLLLQPLIENAILHGLEKKSGVGEISLSIRRVRLSEEEVYLKISIQDNGTGIAPDRLRYIREQLGKIGANPLRKRPESESSAPDVFGLRNVLARLKLAYGSAAKFEIDSALGEGTTVTIWIPILQTMPSIHSMTETGGEPV